MSRGTITGPIAWTSVLRGFAGERSGARLLIQSNHVPGRICEAARESRCIDTNRLDNLASLRDDRVHGRLHAVDHDINQKSSRGGGRTPRHPRSTDSAHRVVERERAVTSPARLPAEDARVERGGAIDVDGRNLEITDLAVRGLWRHPGYSARSDVEKATRVSRPVHAYLSSESPASRLTHSTLQ